MSYDNDETLVLLSLHEKKKKMKEFINEFANLCEKFNIHDVWTTCGGNLVINGDEISLSVENNGVDINIEKNTSSNGKTTFPNKLNLISQKI